MKIKVDFKSIFIVAYYFLLFCLLVLPSLTYSVKYVIIILLSAPLIALYCVSYKKSFQKFITVLFALTMMFIFSFLMNSTFLVSQSINFSILSYLCFLPFFMFDYVTHFDNKITMRLTLLVSSAVFLYVLLVTVKELSVTPTVTRMLASGVEDDPYLNEMRQKNVGGFGFCYAIGMLVPYVAIKSAQAYGAKKVGYLALLATLIFFCLYSQYTTLLIMSIVSCVIIFVIYSKNIFTKFVLIFLGIIALIAMMPIFKFLALNLPFQSLSYHFRLLYESSTSDTEVTARTMFTKTCLELFIKHPFFGVDVTDLYNSYYINNGHSTYFPLLASKGIVGFSFYFGATIYIMKLICSKLRNSSVLIPIFVIYIILGFLNPNNSFAISVMVFFIIPLNEFLYQKKQEGGLLYGRNYTMGN